MKVSELIELLSSSDPDMPVRAVGVAFRTCASGDEKRWTREVILFLPPDVATPREGDDERRGDR